MKAYKVLFAIHTNPRFNSDKLPDSPASVEMLEMLIAALESGFINAAAKQGRYELTAAGQDIVDKGREVLEAA
jgi:hypothetical protein